jgi:hypothetical protein
MWTPPADQVETVDAGWKPPTDAVVSDQTAPAGGGSSQWDVAKAAMSAASDLAPWNKANQALNSAGGAVAQAGGYVGGKLESAGYPTAGNVAQGAGVGLGGAIALSPDILAAYTGMKGLYNSSNPIARGITQAPQEIGQAMNAGEQAAGINPQLPVRSGTLARFPKTAPDVMTVTPGGTAIPGGTSLSSVPDVVPTQYPKNTNALLNHIQNRITQFGDKLSPQELSDYKKILPEMFNKGEVVGGTQPYAMASQLQTKVNDLFNQTVPGRADLNQAYGLSKKLHPDLMTPIQNYIQKYGKKALAEAIGLGGAGAIASRFFK